MTTSMLSNAAKANWTIEERGWRWHEPDLMGDWDGLVLAEVVDKSGVYWLVSEQELRRLRSVFPAHSPRLEAESWRW